MFRSRRDPIGFDPTINQSEFGVPQATPYTNELQATPPMAQVDYFPTWPYKGLVNYIGAQGFGHPITESIYARTHGYRGIMPLEKQPLIDRPYPFQM